MRFGRELVSNGIKIIHRGMAVIIILLIYNFVIAAELSETPGRNTGRPKDSRPKLPEYLPEASPSGVLLPDQSEPKRTASGNERSRFILKGVVFEGNSLFANNELADLAKPFIDSAVSLSDLEELRYRITRFYTDKGYLNSGVIIKPGQIVKNDVVIFKVLEGKLEQIQVTGTQRLNEDYVRKRIWPDTEQVFNSKALQEYFRLLLNDPLIERMDGQLLPGIRPGSAILDLSVERAQPYHFKLSFDNAHSSSSGTRQIRADGTIRNLTGWGDQLNLIGERTKGSYGFELNFSMPLNTRDTRLNIHYGRSNSEIIEEPLANIDIENDYKDFELGFSHPVWKKLSGHLHVGGTLSIRQNQSFLLGEPFPFSPGDDNDGKSRLSALRLWQDIQYRRTDWVFAARSTFSFGLKAFNSTQHDGDIPDSQFLVWLGQFQFAHKVWEKGQLIIRSDIQLANRPLLTMEKYTLGGMDSIRGYRENALVRDQAILVSAQISYPLFKHQSFGQLEVIPFSDYGLAWNEHYSQHKTLWGIGMGLRWTLNEQFNASLYLAHDLKQTPLSSKENLQDRGIHFRLTLNLL